MKKVLCFIFGAIPSLGLGSLPAHAAGLPLVISATVDYTHGTLTISGQNFGSAPTVTLDSLTFPAQSASSSQVVANFPSGRTPSSFTPGTYFLAVTFRNQLPTIFGVDIGANGAQGPAGPAGAQGVTGPAGPAGPQGLPGPMGPPGATGSAGAAGAQGLQGIAGPQGAQGLQGATGATGPQGPAGATGANGTGVPACGSPAPFLVIANGALACQPRFNTNGDGTLTDNQTGLMWEITTSACGGEITCYTNTYDWSDLFSTFLAGLNSDATLNAASTCFANHCDWRIPNVLELRNILIASPCDPSCIDSKFGPTGPTFSAYWSSSSTAANSASAWYVDFGFGDAEFSAKGLLIYARAVRSGR